MSGYHNKNDEIQEVMSMAIQQRDDLNTFIKILMEFMKFIEKGQGKVDPPSGGPDRRCPSGG